MNQHCCPSESSENALVIHTEQSSDVSSHQKTGDFFYNQFKDPRQSQNLLQQAINSYTQELELNEDSDILAQIARVYFLNGQLEMAKRFLQKLMEKPSLEKKTVKKVMETQAALHFRYGEFQQAKDALRTALKYETPWNRAKLHFSLATIQVELIREKATVASWSSGIWHMMLGVLLSPLSEQASSLIPMMQANSFLLLRRFQSSDKALDTYLHLYQQYPGLEVLPVEIGKIYMKQEQYTEAEFWFNRSIYRHPSRDEGYRYLANLYQRTHNTQQLVETLRRWLMVRPNCGEIMMVLSQALAENVENFDESLRLAKQALIRLKSPSMLANTYTHLGNLYGAMQSIDAAILAYQAAITLYPHNLDTFIQLGTLYYDRQEYLLSEQIFEKTMTLSPNNAKILCNLGYLAWMQGDIKKAQAFYHRSIELDPAYDIALNNLGVLYLDHIGDIQKAMELFDQTLTCNPGYALCHYNKGRAYSFLGHTINAAKCFRQAQELNETSQELDNQELTDRIKQLFELSEQGPKTEL